MPQREFHPPTVRDCPECRRSAGMKLQNNGIFTAFYVCAECGVTLTIPPASLTIPAKDFGRPD